MASAGEFAGRLRAYVSGIARGIGTTLRRTTSDLAREVEERPDLGPMQLELPYPLPTRQEPIALALFYFAVLSVVVSATLVATSWLLTGSVPLSIVASVGIIALLLGMAGNLNFLARTLRDRSTKLLQPLVSSGVPFLDALHFWFSPVVAILTAIFALVHTSNNWLVPAAAIVLLVWTVTGLLLKLPKDSPWNGPMLERLAGTLHRRPFIYIVLIAFVAVGGLADLIY